MAVPSLLTICAIALISVFVLLWFLAVVMRLITALFPVPRGTEGDAALVAAISGTVAGLYPGARVTRIEGRG